MHCLTPELLVAILLVPVSARAQHGTVMSAGVELHYRSTGAGTPAVLLSGGPGFAIDYMVPVGDFLPAGYRRILFEQRGTGKSRPASFRPAS
jgi:proline iminopeptidase